MNENIINVKSQTKLSSFTVVFHGSTMNENNGELGLSHLCEHLISKSIDDLLDDFSKYAINWNAYTSESDVVFNINGLEEYVNEYKFKFLNALINKYKLTEDILEKEKKIVLEEYLDGFNSQIRGHLHNFYRKKLNYFLPIGEKSDISSFSLKQVEDFLEKHFANPSKIINVVNDENSFIEENDVKNIQFNNTYFNKNYRYGNYDNKLELNNKFEDKESIFLFSPIIYNKIPELEIIKRMLGYNLNSPLMEELREKHGLAYFVVPDLDILNDNQAIFFIATQTTKGNYQKIYDILSEIFSNPEKYMTKERFDLIKNLMEITIEKREIENYLNTEKYILPDKFSLEKNIHNINYEKIMKTYNEIFNINNWYFSVDNIDFKTKENNT